MFVVRIRRPIPPVAKVVREGLDSPGSVLDVGTRAILEPRLAHDFSRVRVHTGEAAGASAGVLGARAYTVGRDIVFGRGEYAPSTLAGRRVLAHELTHVVQQSVGSVDGKVVGGVKVGDPTGRLESLAESTAANLPGPARPENTSRAASGPATGWPAFRPTLQRLIVNVGDDPLAVELRKPEGWIIAKDIEIALRDGGVSQTVMELHHVAGYVGLRRTENVYLVGHGAPTLVGVKTGRQIAQELNIMLPEDYAGSVKSLSCSTGIGANAWDVEQVRRLGSGAAELAAYLERVSVPVEGAYGIALNHPAFRGGRRTVKPTNADWAAVSTAIVATQGAVNDAWRAYIAGVASPQLLDQFMTVPLMAEALSRPFYVALEARIEPHLVPKDKDATIVLSTGTGFSALLLDVTQSAFKA